MTAIRAVGFDLGETLLRYRGTPLSWASLYEPALAAVAAACGLAPSLAQVNAATEILRRHNTRLFPREREVVSGEIFFAVLAAWRVPLPAPAALLDAATSGFFGYFRHRLETYPDTLTVLDALHARGLAFTSSSTCMNTKRFTIGWANTTANLIAPCSPTRPTDWPCGLASAS